MALSPLLSAYLATINPSERGMVGPDTPRRPDGAVVWAICSEVGKLDAVHALAAQLVDDGERLTVVASLSATDDPDIQITPNTKASTRAFLAHWRPDIVLWFGGPLDPLAVLEIARIDIPALYIEASSANLDQTTGRRVPGLLRGLLSTFREIMTTDQATETRLKRMGIAPEKIRNTGPLEEGAAPPPYSEAERADLSRTLGSRPMWFAANVPLEELSQIANAHRYAARRAHMTLLILCPRTPSDAKTFVERLRADGFSVACRIFDDPPRDATQIYVVEPEDGLGLWCRLAPVTYLGGSLSDGMIPDPFAPATVGSAVLAGPEIVDHRKHFDRLFKAGAVHSFVAGQDFGKSVDSLLATALAAQLAHNAWDVTSQGADATNQLVTLVYKYLDEVSY